jgi:hypothetical protein
MLKVGRRRGFRPETLDELGIGELAAQQQLHGHDAVERHLLRLEHHAHAAAVDFLEHLVIAETAQLQRP